ncbi:MAG: insulinase family protein [Bacteroidia bacterium]|nr:insulinase family protein [Bacteroidia bacterium]
MQKLAYQSRVLNNGLHVLVHEDHSVPKAVVDIIYKVGSKDEDPERTGFAHLFEHLMFEGSKNIPQYDIPLQRVGGENNAFTTADVTNYFISLPSSQLETAFWLESDRMLELAFSEEKLEIQKKVVIEEYKQRYLNQPYGDAFIKLRALHYKAHPYQWPTIGKEIRHIEEATLQDVKDFFFGYYAPNNATLVVVGDVVPEEVFDLAEKWFGPIPSRKLKKHPITQEPRQEEVRKAHHQGNVPIPAIYKMYHIPGNVDQNYYVADILTDLLSNGKSGILFQHMVKNTQLSSGTQAFSWGLHDPGVISIDGKLAEGVSFEQFEGGLKTAIEMLEATSQEDLDRIKRKLQATFVLQKTNFLNKAIAFAMSDALGDIELINTTPEIYQNIKLDEVKAAVKDYFREDNSSTLYYSPVGEAI